MSDIYDHFPQIVASARHTVVILEIGAGRGEDTIRMVEWLRTRKREYHFFAYEAEANNIATIKAKVGERATVVFAAVGDKDGETPFISSGSWPLSGSVKRPKEHLKSYPWIPWQEPVTIPMVRLDSVFIQNRLTKVDFLWLDVQGAEDLVISGAQEALKRTRFLYTEFYSTEEYEGQIGLAEIHKRLPGRWKIVEQWPGDIPGNGDVLFRNLDFR